MGLLALYQLEQQHCHDVVVFVQCLQKQKPFKCLKQGTAVYGVHGMQATLQCLEGICPKVDHALPSWLLAAKGNEHSVWQSLLGTTPKLTHLQAARIMCSVTLGSLCTICIRTSFAKGLKVRSELLATGAKGLPKPAGMTKCSLGSQNPKPYITPIL